MKLSYKILTILFFVVFIFVGGCAQLVDKESIPPEKYCTNDDDCVKVNVGCCNCNMGGTAKAVNKEYYTPPNCEGILCMAVISKDWTCFAEPRCIDNECTLVKN